MAQFAARQEPTLETLSSAIAQMPLVLGADGVIAPIRHRTRF